MPTYRPYTVSVSQYCSQIGEQDKQVFFLCVIESETGKRYAEWNGCEDMNGSRECADCHLKMVKEFSRSHPDYVFVG